MRIKKDWVLIILAIILISSIYIIADKLIVNERYADGMVLNDHTILTEDGNEWTYYSDLPKGKKVEVVFSTAKSVNRTDDKIVEVRYHK